MILSKSYYFVSKQNQYLSNFHIEKTFLTTKRIFHHFLSKQFKQQKHQHYQKIIINLMTDFKNFTVQQQHTRLQNALLIFNINIYGSFTWRANLSVCRIWCEHKVILKWCDNNIYDNLKGQCKTWNNNNNDDNNTMRIAYINCWDDDAPRSSTTTTTHTYAITIKCAI